MGKVLVTGVAGFIGFHLCERLLKEGREVLGVDNMCEYYDTWLKEARLSRLEGREGFSFLRRDVSDREGMALLFEREPFETVVHLAAQAGVRYSIINPYPYIDSNLLGIANILEGCRKGGVRHLVFASSSSVYGANTRMPYSEHHGADHPVSLYGATKRAGELMAHAYSSLYGIPSTGLRFFTVYGPWGRPDMAYFIFTKAISEGRPIDVYNQGRMKRDFTFIDDIIEAVVRVMEKVPAPDPQWDPGKPDPAISFAPFRLYNIGNNRPVELIRFIEVLEGCLGKKALKNLLPIQLGDVEITCADVDDLMAGVGFKASTSIEDGLMRFVQWYRDYYSV